MLYEVFERLIFGVSCLIFCPSLEGMVCLCRFSWFFLSRVGLMILFLDCGNGKCI